MIEILGLVLSIIGSLLAIGSGCLWFLSQRASAERKKYAAERAFEHLKKNQENLNINLANFFQDIESKLDSINDNLQEIKFNCRGYNKDE